MKAIQENKIIKYLKANKVQGLIYIPDYGILSLFADKKTKSYILDELRVELMTQEMIRENRARTRSQQDITPTSIKEASTYIQ